MSRTLFRLDISTLLCSALQLKPCSIHASSTTVYHVYYLFYWNFKPFVIQTTVQYSKMELETLEGATNWGTSTVVLAFKFINFWTLGTQEWRLYTSSGVIYSKNLHIGVKWKLSMRALVYTQAFKRVHFHSFHVQSFIELIFQKRNLHLQ